MPNLPFLDSILHKKVVRPAGFEPTTYCSGGSRSIQMSYGRNIFPVCIKPGHARKICRHRKKYTQYYSSIPEKIKSYL